jgi:membrane fusion protein, multidrug efflux system
LSKIALSFCQKIPELSEFGCHDSDESDARGNRPLPSVTPRGRNAPSVLHRLPVLALTHSTVAQQQQPTAVPVGVVRAERKPIARTIDFVGRVEAISRVEIRARITGFLEEVVFKEGDVIKEGTLLYRIEKGLFQAQVEQAEGAPERSKAAKILSAVQLARAEELAEKQAGSLAARDQARAQDQQARGAVMTDEANLTTARINVGYTDIVSPITGKVGRTSLTKGNVVSPTSGPLTVIVSQDPMYVSFPVSQREFLRVQAAGRQVEIGRIKARVHFGDGTAYQYEGGIKFVDVQVDRSTDTILVRATFPNPEGALVDGQFVRVQVESDKPEERVVIPQGALIADQEGVYVFAVDEGKAVIKRIKPGNESGTGVVVDEGLTGGELVVVDGLSLLRPGIAGRTNPSRTLAGD